MNFPFVAKQLGLLLLVLSVILVALATAFFVTEAVMRRDVNHSARDALFITGALGAALGGGVWLWNRRAATQLGRREALLLVAVSWIFGAAVAGLPYFLWANLPGTNAADDHPFRTFDNCYFEAMSGLTTTGATILSNIEAVPRSLLLWRGFTQWLGGLGIVVLFVAVLPTLGVGGKKLFRVEAPGPTQEGLQPHIRQTARVLLYIYLALTGAEILALWAITPMNLYDAVCHAMTTVATAGFSTRSASIGAYDSPAVDAVVIVFMVLASVNFGLYFALVRRKFGTLWRDPELRTYAVLLVVASLIIVFCLTGHPITTTTGRTVEGTAGAAIRYGLFTSASIGTTTGYANADFNLFPFLAKAVLVLLMFVGGMAGSTAGGIKVIRIWIAFKVMWAEIERAFRPQVVRPVRVGATIIDDELKLSTIAYVLGIVFLFAAGSAFLMMMETLVGEAQCDFATAAGASIACLLNIGPGLAGVGAVENYGWLTPASKSFLCLLMVLGRLEVFAIIVLLSPRFWMGD